MRPSRCDVRCELEGAPAGTAACIYRRQHPGCVVDVAMRMPSSEFIMHGLPVIAVGLHRERAHVPR